MSKKIFLVFPIILCLFVLILAGCSKTSIKECRIFDEKNNNWDVGVGLLCDTKSDCDQNKYSFLKGYQVDCLPSKYVYDKTTDCETAIKDREQKGMPETAIICKNGKTYMTEGVRNQYLSLLKAFQSMAGIKDEDLPKTEEEAKDMIEEGKEAYETDYSKQKNRCVFTGMECIENREEGNNIIVKLKSTQKYPINIAKDKFSITGCINAEVISVNGITTFPVLINPNEEYTLIMACSESVESMDTISIKLLYENTETGLIHSIDGTIS